MDDRALQQVADGGGGGDNIVMADVEDLVKLSETQVHVYVVHSWEELLQAYLDFKETSLT